MKASSLAGGRLITLGRCHFDGGGGHDGEKRGGALCRYGGRRMMMYAAYTTNVLVASTERRAPVPTITSPSGPITSLNPFNLEITFDR